MAVTESGQVLQEDDIKVVSAVDSAASLPAPEASSSAPLRQTLFRFASWVDVGLLAIGLLAVICSGANQPLQLIVFGSILDSFNSSNPSDVKDRIHFFAGAYALLGLQQLATNLVQIGCFEAVAARRGRRLRESYVEGLLRRPLRFFDSADAGALAASVMEAAADVASGTGQELAMLLQRLFAFVVGLSIAFYISWKFALMVCAGLPCLAAVVAVANRSFARRAANSNHSLGSATSLAMESLSSLRTVAALGLESFLMERYQAMIQSACREGIYFGAAKAALEATVSPIMFFMFGLGLWWGSKLVSDDMESMEACRFVSPTGSLQDPDPSICQTGGQIMTAFLSILFGFMGLIQALPGLSAMGAARASMAKILQVVDAPTSDMDPLASTAMEESSYTAKVIGRVEFREVRFAYPARPGVFVCQGLSLVAEAGETVALVGPSGCGKSTVVSLLERFYDPDEGQVLLDDVNIRSVPIAWLRAQVGLVSQEPVLFSGSIVENIALGRKGGADQQEVESAAQLANAHDFIKQFPEGYHTQVGEKGIQLSGGQKQRIAIARAIVRDPAILILDEATSALDAASERVVQAALDKLLSTKRRTTLVIAHRLSTVQGADKIAVLAGGRLAEEGTHEELLKNESGLYRSLVEAQLANAEDQNGEPEPALQETTDGKQIAVHDSGDVVGAASVSEEAKEKNASKQKDGDLQKKTSLGWIWRLSLPEKWFLLSGLLGAIITGLTLPAIGFLMAEFIVVFFNNDVAAMRREAQKWALVFLGFGAVASLGAAIRQFSFAVVTQRLALRVRESAFQSLLRQHIGWFDVSESRKAGALTSRLSQDCSMLQALTGERASIALSQLVVLVGGLGISFAASWELTLLVFGIVPGIAVPIALQAKVVARFAEQAAKASVDAAARATEMVLNIRTVAAFGLERHSLELFARGLDLPTKQDIRKGLVGGLGTGLAAGVVLFGAGFKYYIGGIFFDMGMVTFPAIMRCVLVLIFMAFGLTSVSKDASDKAEAMMAARRVHEIISAKSDIDPMPSDVKVPDRPMDKVVGCVEFIDVQFAYPARKDAPVCKGLSFRVEAGQTVALVGPSGCGKSTVVSLLERFYDPDEGRVLLDGCDLRSLPVSWLRAQIGLVSQEPVLFSGSIMENIALGKRERAEQHEVQSAAQLANAHDFIEQFPEGYETPVGEKGIQLSGGQKQRIAIARAIVRDPTILVLDEATSALDATSERVVQAALDTLLNTKRRTTVVIAHRLSTVQNADKIIVFSEGRVAEEGVHAQLMSKDGGIYRSLVAHSSAGAKVSTSSCL